MFNSSLLESKYFLHNQVFLPQHLSKKSNLTISAWWKEYGALIEISPRQSGKTTGLIRIYNHLGMNWHNGDIRYLCHNQTTKSALLCKGLGGKNLVTPDFFVPKEMSAAHLLVDEFMYMPTELIEEIFNHDWLSLTMVSTWK